MSVLNQSIYKRIQYEKNNLTFWMSRSIDGEEGQKHIRRMVSLNVCGIINFFVYNILLVSCRHDKALSVLASKDLDLLRFEALSAG